ncbi:PREDICTED: uncharacterized protein LOC104811649 [Tarenaya hassleriana]|uniref:uncharacterized protein LOC104811649 n=1 Tax=Tarenaya hassleriana TaxID=28532 RepID=UPI00053C3BD6|nr:PREDICTED: uncharacterized protein LOC104811649 [Tarenaya hassleriana]
MDSPKSVVSPFMPSLIAETENENFISEIQSSGLRSNGIGVNGKDPVGIDPRDCIGSLEVHVHQARDIQNICIYHKQDVYAKLCLTNDPEKAVSTKIINGGGRNPVFGDILQLNVRVLDTSLKCEIYMMSRVRNYLEDQLLGFALVPLSEVVFNNGKLEKEFSLSSTDLFHSPAGFVQLSLSYNGAYPDVMAIPVMPATVAVDETTKKPKGSEPIPSELDKIEFPDPNVVNENEIMVSEYFGISCSSMDSETSDSLVTSDAENQASAGTGVTVAESFSAAAACSVNGVVPKQDSPDNGAYSPHTSANSATSDAPAASDTPNHEHVSDSTSGQKSTEAESETSEIMKPILTVNVEPEPKVVQQEIVDMYMKSMQQFTESLAKMKLPLDIDSPTKSENSSSEQKLQTPNSNGSRVFYGSRPFF